MNPQRHFSPKAAPRRVPSVSVPACIACQVPLMMTEKPFGEMLHCPSCGLYRLAKTPEPVDAHRRYEGFYDKEESTRFNPILETLTGLIRSFRVRNLRRYCGKPGRLLDIGFGRPRDLSIYQEAGWTAEGTQIVPHVVEIAKQRGLTAHLGDLLRLRLPSGQYDAVTLWHVLEHLSQPQDYLQEIHRLLKPSGALVFEVPNVESPVARFFGSAWFELDPPNHLWQFTPLSLERLLKRQGFIVERRWYFSAEQSVFSFIQSALNLGCKDRNLLFEALKKNTERPAPLRLAAHYLLAALLLPLAGVVTVLLALIGEGDTIRLHCRKVPRERG